MHAALSPDTYLLLARERFRENEHEARQHAVAVRLVRLRRREREVQRATTRARLARVAVG